ALMALKRKKQYESQIEKISGTRMTMETQMMAIESASVNLETIKAMEKVDDTMDSIREQMDLADEISNAISAPMLGADLIDDDELTAELDELEQEVLDSQLLGAEAPPFIAPKVPKTELVIESEEDKELEELRAAMAL
ncbi:17302_t:CDS:2, partial [Entrophospora sp. SA101]